MAVPRYGSPVRAALMGSIMLFSASVRLLAQGASPAPYDFDGDGRTDITVTRRGEFRFLSYPIIWYQIRSSDDLPVAQEWGRILTSSNGIPLPSGRDRPIAADFDGDGKTDIAVFNQGNWRILGSSDGAMNNRSWGSPGFNFFEEDIPVPGDYDGDGVVDLAVWHRSTGVWSVLRSSDGSADIRAWGSDQPPYSDVPVPADYDGDGKMDIAVWRSSTGVWYIIRSSDGVATWQQWGAGYAPYNDVAVPGDYDGDGKTDIAVWRSSTGIWYIIRSSDGTATWQQWGIGYAPYNDVPVPGDYDGDGKTDVAVWRPLDGTWYLIGSTDGSVVVRQWGQNGDAPLPGRR